MRPLILTLKNFIGIRDGMRRDEVTIDFTNCRGLVALAGDNGSGKSTIIDSMTPYRIMASRAAGYSPRQFSYYDETFGEARKILTWFHQGRNFRTEIIIKGANKTKKTEAYLYEQTPGGWVPASTVEGQVSDGKTDTYDDCVNEILGTPEMFFTAIFAAQGRKGLADYAAGDIKGLLSELLGLDDFIALAKRASEAAKHQSAVQTGLGMAVTLHDRARGDLQIAQDAYNAADAAMPVWREEQLLSRARAQKAQQALSEMRSRMSSADDIRRRRIAVNTAILHETSRKDTEARGFAQRRTTLRMRRGVSIMQADLDALNTRIARLSGQIAADKLRLQGLPDSVAARNALADAQFALTLHDETAQKLQSRINDAAGAPAALAAAKAAVAQILTDGRAKKADLNEHTARAALTKTVPCADMSINSECALLKDAHASEARVAKLATEQAGLRVSYELKLAEVGVAEEEVAALNSLRDEMAALAPLRTPLARAVTEANAKVADAASSSEIQKGIDRAKQEIEDARAATALKLEAIDSAKKDADTELAQIDIDEQGAMVAADTRIEAFKIELAALPPEPTAESDAQAQREAELANEAANKADGEVVRLQAELTRRGTEIQMLKAKVAEGSDAAERSRALDYDIAQWKLLERGLGRDGIVALSIDDAGPTLSGITNELLSACYGPRFSVRFDTQAENKSGVMKETFDIRVFDAEGGDDKSVQKMSGGECVYINDPLTRAIALFKARQSGQSYHALFSDESDGALSPEKKVEFMKMKRKVLLLGGYDVEFFITHTPALIEMADQVIDIGAMRLAA